mmetsp:Transcript_23103/g.40866  ORF Transcript_23103/g.40866 Transcript_23103/m.40866 type:complete len:759 (+) Transcript_23103:1316-3592(+)
MSQSTRTILLDPPRASESKSDASFLLLGGCQSPNENGFLHELLSPMLTYLQQHPDTDILLIGDFNARHISHCSRTNALGRLLLEVSDTLGIQVLNQPQVPTYYRSKKPSSTIDLAVSTPELVHSVNVLTEWGVGSDHLPIAAHLNITPPASALRCSRMLDLRNADFDRLNKDTLTNFPLPALQSLDTERIQNQWSGNIKDRLRELVRKFSTVLHTAVEKHIGCVHKGVITPSTPFWWTPSIQKQANVTRKMETDMRQAVGTVRSRVTTRRHAAARKKLQKLSRASRVSSWRSFCDQSQQPDKMFDIHKRSLGRPSIPGFRSDINGQMCISPLQKATAFNDLMKKIGTKTLSQVPRHERTRISSEHLRLCDDIRLVRWAPIPDSSLSAFQPKQIQKLASGLRTRRTSPGIDGITNQVLASLSEDVFRIIAMLFRCLHSAGLFAQEWKKAFLSPIPKGISVHQASDLRPIALLSCLGKLMERVVLPLCTAEFDTLDITPDHQAAFRRRRSTHEHLTVFTDTVTKLNRDTIAVALLLDVSKAFNSVWHERLLVQLHAKGLPLHMIRFLASWLSDRQCATRIDGAISAFLPHTRGVPQGSVLSPLLFNAYFSSALEGIDGLPLLYADDAAIIITAPRSELTSALQRMQQNAAIVHSWCVDHAFRLNAGKCKLLVFARNREIQRNSASGVRSMEVQGTQVHTSPYARYLGVWFDPAMTFRHHCTTVLSKCSRRAGLILRLGGHVWGCPPQCMIRLFRAVISSK